MSPQIQAIPRNPPEKHMKKGRIRDNSAQMRPFIFSSPALSIFIIMVWGRQRLICFSEQGICAPGAFYFALIFYLLLK
ncbi:hypothetical protein H8711_07825 [Clostridiaceae bacterium NSJ-31]|uniref:Uncharacterized protein n=1 Tax=Ligaoa zhengdingensis TaxID=2763658 RepID=A0A926E114_9FIRM|nr:hypothetical protein [Ligaoa zhengdingensis]MBC8546840.1 hypothetical protein [Ligaoa zhengdingensis]